MNKKVFKLVSFILSLMLAFCCGCKENPNTESEFSTEIEYVYEEIELSGEGSGFNSGGDNSYMYSESTASKPDKSDGDNDNLDESQTTVSVKGEPIGYLSNNGGSYRLTSMNSTEFKIVKNSEKNISGDLVIELDPTAAMHTIEGFGGSLTDTTCANLAKMTEADRNFVLESFFSKEKGIGLNYLRQPCGVTDYALNWQTYDDMPQGQTDTTLAYFSIDADRDYIIPAVKKAIAINPNIRVISSVWSPPLWMKTEYEWTSKNGAKLNPKYYGVFSQYIVKFIKAYEAEGIPIYSMVPQNEPTGKHGIPAAYYTADDMADLINNHLAPAFENAGIKTQIWSWDFNFFREDAKAFTKKSINNVQGIAMHYPSNDVQLINELLYQFNLPVFLTETGGSQNFDNLVFEVSKIIGYLNAGASTLIRWNLVLDQNGGPSDPRNPHLFKNPNEVGDGPIGYNSDTDTVTKLADYYVLGHFSKFIDRGSRVLYLNSKDIGNDFVQCLAVKNPDGTVVTVLTNLRPKTLETSIVYGKSIIKFKIPSESVISLVWNG